MLPHAKILAPLQYFLILLANVFALKHHDLARISYRQNEFVSNSFAGNESMSVYLRLLYLEKDTALFGGRNVVYNISLADLSELKENRIVWNPTQAHIDLCKLKGKSDDDCHNYIRVAAKINDTMLYVCGTNAYKPLCQKYSINETEPVVIQQNIEGNGKCPFDPTHNSTAIFAGGHLYSATVTDFSGSDPVIYREPLRTERSDLKQLNEPNFVGSISFLDHMYFFFREPAVEHINCGKVIYSRVARVCKNDKGGPTHIYRDRWTSFLKSRLNCSIPGEYPFYFNEIQAISDIIESEYNGVDEHVVYGVFNTPVNSIGGSAVCAFSLRAIIDTFNGPFKEQENMNSNWMPVSNYKIPEPRPGTCVSDSRTLPATSVNFVKSHSLMDEAVPAFHSHPVFIRISWQYRLSAIAVDPKVKTINGEKMDVLFLGTDDGKILKVVSIIGYNVTDVKVILTEELQVIEGASIRKLSIVRPTNAEPSLLVVSDSKITSIPLQRCLLRKTCKECTELQDPYCLWDTYKEKCVALQENDLKNSKYLIQNVTSGLHKTCIHNTPTDTSTWSKEDDDTNNIDLSKCPSCDDCNAIEPCVREDSHRDKIAVVYITDTMGLLIGSCVLVTLVVGFAAGYMCSRHFRADPYSNVSLHSNHQLNRLTEPSLNSESGPTLLPPCSNNKAATLNLVLNVTKNSNDKNSTIDNKTLQKVKKTYI